MQQSVLQNALNLNLNLKLAAVMQLRRVRGRPHRQDVRVHGTHLHHVGVVWLVAPAGGVVVDVQDGDVHLEHGTT